MFNIISFISFIIMILLSKLLEKTPKQEIILRSISILLFIYKFIHYIIENINGNIAIPVEISSISYFLMFIILIFKIKSLYCVGAFYGIMAGLGYFLFYTLLGFTVLNHFTIKDILIGCFSHGYLLICGIYFYKNYKFTNAEKSKIWITLFAMLCWGLVFYDVQTRGITFIYYIIKPQFLFMFNNMIFNILVIISYYAILATAFYFVVKLFFKLNNNPNNNNLLKNQLTITK